jgi:ketosteroid isomerase-like protein
MRICDRFGKISSIIVGLIGASGGVAFLTHAQAFGEQDRIAQDKIAIERLHQQDVEATLSGKADDLAKLWDSEAVRIEAGRPAEISKAVIYSNDKRSEAKSDGKRILCYKPEVQDLQIAGDWAFEWGYFSYKASANAQPVTGRGKVLRVLKRQPDGSWKFARVMVLTEKLESAAPVSNPCE